MKPNKIALALVAIVVLGAGTYGPYRVGVSQGMKLSSAPGGAATGPSSGALKAGDIDPTTGKKVLYWHDPMVPGQKFDQPGKSPFMNMQLVPVYADGVGDESKVSISPRVQQNLGVRTAEVTKGSIAPAVEAVGSVAYNERDVTVVQARSNGYVEKLFVRAPLDAVRKGQALAEIYSPDWVAAQEEFLSAKRIASQAQIPGLASLVDGVRQRMRLAGMTEEQIRVVESTSEVHPRLTLAAPSSGVVAELSTREGMTVMSGAALFRINGLGSVWVNAEVPEAAAAQVRPGNVVEARTPAFPGTTFKGRVSAILPEVNAATRTLKARVEIANPQGKLVPGMFTTVNFTPTASKEVLLVPTEAVITTGKRSIVIVVQGEGRFAPVDVETGIDANSQTEIRKGLAAGQKVVVSGQFLLDSEASLKASETRMSEPASVIATPVPTNTVTHRGQGTVEKIDPGQVTLSHGPIPTLQWGAMTMGFHLPPGMAKGIAVGDKVDFEFRQTADGAFEITRMTPQSGAAKATTGGMESHMQGMQK